MTIGRTLLIALTGTLAASAAQSADYGPIYSGLLESAPELRPVEIGTGWYLRGDVGYELNADTDASLSASTPFERASVPFDRLRMDDAFTGGAGFGYRFTEYLRADLTARYGRHDVDGSLTLPDAACFAGAQCVGTLSTKARTWDLMANAYVDLGTVAGFTPYVGGGLGAVNVDYGDISATGCVSFPGSLECEDVGFDGADSWRFAYNLQAGVAYNFNRSLALDVGYRYLNVDGGTMTSGPIAPGIDFAAEDDGYDRHTITAGLRYSLW